MRMDILHDIFLLYVSNSYVFIRRHNNDLIYPFQSVNPLLSYYFFNFYFTEPICHLNKYKMTKQCANPLLMPFVNCNWVNCKSSSNCAYTQHGCTCLPSGIQMVIHILIEPIFLLNVVDKTNLNMFLSD